MRTREERQRDFAAMQRTVAEAQAQAETMQRKLEEQQRQVADTKALIEEYWMSLYEIRIYQPAVNRGLFSVLSVADSLPYSIEKE